MTAATSALDPHNVDKHDRFPGPLAALVVCLALIGCDVAVTTPGPGATADPSASSMGTSGPGDTGAPASAGPPAARPPAGPSVRSLPLPTLTEPFAIGEALYDPSRVDKAIASLLQLMGIGVYQADGTAVRVGQEQAPGDPWLLEDEVWGMIDAEIEDFEASGGEEPQYRLRDLYDQIGRLLPDLSFDRFVAAYRDSYAEHPDELAPAVLLGQPVDASTPLTRAQLWLLFMDGFVELAEPSTAGLYPGALVAVAPNRPVFGTASRILPPLIHPQTLSNEEWRELRTHMLTIGFAIWFTLDPPLDIHEGHGSPGATYSIPVEVGRGQVVRSPTTGNVILEPNPGPLDGLAVTWTSLDRGVLDEHGTLGASLPSTVLTDGSGRAFIDYTTNRELADGVGVETREWASLQASALVDDLIRRAYLIDDESVDWLLSTGYFHQSRSAGPGFMVAWHGPGLEIEIVNDYDVTLQLLPAGLEGIAYRNGKDTFKGTLVLDSEDQSFRGTLVAKTEFVSTMTFTAPLAGGTCGDMVNGDLTETTQLLYVVAQQLPLDWRRTDSPTPTPLEGTDLLLSFYPGGSISGTISKCMELIPYLGPRPVGEAITRWYAPYLDARITTPANGYRVHVPAAETWTYTDRDQVDASLGISSTFKVTVTWVDGP